MTSITPPSFVDDGLGLPQRVPRRSRWDINKWIESTTVTVASGSTYTGSFVDDGGDMRIPSRYEPGFGTVDRNFYTEEMKNKSEVEADWSEEVARAVSGDMSRSLAKMQDLANIKIIGDEEEDAETRNSPKEEEEDIVWIPMPLTFGQVVIECEDGRVIVVDKDGEYDSGLPGETMKWRLQKIRREDKKKGAHKKQGSSSHHSRKRHKVERYMKDEKARHEEDKQLRTRNRKVKGRRHHEQDEGNLTPTKFFTTGGASCWSTASSSSARPPSPAASHRPSLPGAWPSPAPSQVKQSWPAPSRQTSVSGSRRLSASPSSRRSATTSIMLRQESRDWGEDAWPQSSHSAAVSQDSWKEDGCWKQSARSPAPASYAAGSNASWKQDVDEFYSRLSPPRAMSDTPFPARQSEADIHSIHTQSSSGSSTSGTATVHPYSWRRAVEEESICSTRGSSESQHSSKAASRDSWVKENERRWTEEADNRSVKSYSTYKAPTVEDAPDTSEGEKQQHEWHTSWGVTGSNNGSSGYGSIKDDMDWRANASKKGSPVRSWRDV